MKRYGSLWRPCRVEEGEQFVALLQRSKLFTNRSVRASAVCTVRRAGLAAVAVFSFRLGFDVFFVFFSLSLWLQENIAQEIEGFQATFSYAYDGTMAMADLVKMVKVFHKHSGTLQQLQKQFPPQDRSLGKTAQTSIKDWENRQREINYIIDAIQEWKKNASAHIYDLVVDSQTSEVLLTEEMLNLPTGLS